MLTLIEILNLATQYLQKRNISNPRRQAEILLCDALHFKRLDLYTQSDRPLTEKELEVCRERLARRSKGEPLQYIHGVVEFLDCHIMVNPSVLIPRQETEILADKIIQQLSKENQNNKILWDICCGSGCIGIAIKKKLPDLHIVLSDVSENALEIATKNAQANEVEVQIIKGDLFEPFKSKQANYIVCNPPYVSEAEFENLDKEVKDFEPRLALVSGPTGLEFYQKIANELPRFLIPGGKAWFELGASQGAKVLALFKQGPWKEVNLEQDWSSQDRFISLIANHNVR